MKLTHEELVVKQLEAEFLQNECDCKECREMCQRPCWPTPTEARRLIENGYAHMLMIDYWYGSRRDKHKDIYLLCPAEKGRKQSTASFFPMSGCSLQIPGSGACALHGSGLKPIEARLAACKKNARLREKLQPRKRKHTNIHFRVAKLWDNPEAQKLVEEWKTLVNF
jgi:hypothetical protein